MSFFKAIKVGHCLCPSAVRTPVSRITWRLLISKHGDIYLHHLALLSTDQGVNVLNKLAKEYEASQSWYKKVVPFLVPVVYTATLSPLRIEDTSGSIPCIVDIDQKHRSHVLTNGLHNPDSLPRTADFLISYNRFAVTLHVPGISRQRDALLVKLELHKITLLVFLLISFLVSVGLGFVVGLLRHDLDSGLGVSGVVLGTIGLVEGWLTWKIKN